MPYTPPSRGSPATSNAASPIISRNHSYEKASSRPELPRSRSAVYIQRHRRTPSLADKNHQGPHSPLSVNSNTAHNAGSSQNGLLGRGLTSSPITSYSPEDDEYRGRQKQLKDLADTLRESMTMTKRPHSPTRTEEGPTPVAPKSTPVVVASIGTSSPALTPEARKISHSRSASEIQLAAQSNHPDIQGYSPGESDGDDDDALEMRPGPLLRKKSGELVKPALRTLRRPSSAPGTPTYHKAVHFNEDIQQVRHFLQVDRPIAVSAGSSPVEIYDSESDYPFKANQQSKPSDVEWEIRTANFPKNTEERRYIPVRIEELHLSKDSKNLIGVVAVANIAFEKFVVARFTFDYWKTTSEVFAEFSHGPNQQNPSDGYDRFQFSIKLSDQANLQNKTLYLCVRYNAGGQEHWDSNLNHNFQVDFIRKVAAKAPVRPAQPAAASIPRSRGGDRTSPMIRPRSFPSSSADDEFSTGFDSPFKMMRKSPDLPVRMKPSKEATAPANPPHHGARLSNRYDFGASLQAALTNAQIALGDRSGLKIVAPQPVKRTLTAPAPAPAVQSPEKLSRPELNSREYNDLIQKFCYFGSNGNNSGIVSPETAEKAQPKAVDFQQMDGAVDSGSESNVSTAGSSSSNSPPSPKAQIHQVEPLQDPKASNRTPSPSLRALSPRLLPYRSPSPATSAYQEFPHQGLSVQTTQC